MVSTSQEVGVPIEKDIAFVEKDEISTEDIFCEEVVQEDGRPLEDGQWAPFMFVLQPLPLLWSFYHSLNDFYVISPL